MILGQPTRVSRWRECRTRNKRAITLPSLAPLIPLVTKLPWNAASECIEVGIVCGAACKGWPKRSWTPLVSPKWSINSTSIKPWSAHHLCSLISIFILFSRRLSNQSSYIDVVRQPTPQSKEEKCIIACSSSSSLSWHRFFPKSVITESGAPRTRILLPLLPSPDASHPSQIYSSLCGTKAKSCSDPSSTHPT